MNAKHFLVIIVGLALVFGFSACSNPTGMRGFTEEFTGPPPDPLMFLHAFVVPTGTNPGPSEYGWYTACVAKFYSADCILDNKESGTGRWKPDGGEYDIMLLVAEPYPDTPDRGTHYIAVKKYGRFTSENVTLSVNDCTIVIDHR